MTKGSVKRLDLNGVEIENLSRVGSWPSAAVEQVDYFCDLITSSSKENPFMDHFKHQAFVEACYLSDKSKKAENPKEIYRKLK